MPTNGNSAMTIGHSNHPPPGGPVPRAAAPPPGPDRHRRQDRTGQQALSTLQPQQFRPHLGRRQHRLHLRRRTARRPAGSAGTLHDRRTGGLPGHGHDRRFHGGHLPGRGGMPEVHHCPHVQREGAGGLPPRTPRRTPSCPTRPRRPAHPPRPTRPRTPPHPTGAVDAATPPRPGRAGNGRSISPRRLPAAKLTQPKEGSSSLRRHSHQLSLQTLPAPNPDAETSTVHNRH